MSQGSSTLQADAGQPAAVIIPIATPRLGAWLSERPGAQATWLQRLGFSAKPGQHALLPGADGTLEAVIVGEDPSDALLSFGALSRALPPGLYRLDPNHPAERRAEFAHAFGLGSYRFDRYRASDREPATLLIDTHSADLQRVQAELRAAFLVRDLVNTPTEDMGPEHLADLAASLAAEFAADVQVCLGEQLLQDGYPAVHAVGRASHRAPRMIELDWGDPTHPLVVVVGKGVCFDTGGLNIKGGDGMRLMKKDMGGAAHALGLAQLIMARRLPVRLKVLVPAVENAIAGNAFRPGEVLATRAGLSVEVDNTDAEGRLILCDALARAAEDKPALILDFATLTGAARIALGPDLPVLFCNDEGWAADFLRAGEDTSDRLWRLPLHRPYLRYLESSIADLMNAGATRHAGAITAALFMSRFIPDGQPWIHIDVFSWSDGDRPGRPKGGEAQGLRAALTMLERRFGG